MGQRTIRICIIPEPEVNAGDSGADVVKTMPGAGAPRITRELGSHLESVRRRVQRNCALVPAAKAVVQRWNDELGVESSAQDARRATHRSMGDLHRSAEMADRYAAATMVIAVAALGLAELAALEALIARQDALAILAPSPSKLEH